MADLRTADFKSPGACADFARLAQKATGAAIAVAGTGYTAGDLLTVVGGTGRLATVIKVTTVTTGAVTAVSVEVAGAYTTNPTNPVAVTGGTGSGATFNLTMARAITSDTDIQRITERAGAWHLFYWN